MTTGPVEEQGYEGTGLGPKDHDDPTRHHVEDEDLEHDGLGPRRAPEHDREGSTFEPEEDADA